MSELLQDLRYALRTLARNPGFTAAAVITLALGLGATTTIFSVVDAAMLRPLPYPEPDRLVRVWETTTRGDDFSMSEPNYLDFAASNRSFESMAAFKQVALSLTGAGEPERLEAMAVTHTLFPLLDASPLLGRTFLAAEDVPGADTRVAVLSHELWQRRFGGDARVVGESITLDGQSHTVTGVMRPGFDFPEAELWVPLAPRPHSDRGEHSLDGIGRLSAGVTIERAEVDLEAIAVRIGEQHPDVAGWGVRLEGFHEWLVGRDFRRTSLVLLGAVGFLLLMACANLANLLFARATTRQTELGIRAALGAGGGRIVRQLLTESALLALLGAAAGVLGAFWAVEALKALQPAGVPRLDEVSVNGRVLGFSLTLGLLTSVLFGLAPAVRASRIDVSTTLKEGGRGRTMDGNHRIRDLLVVGQVATAMMLLVGAGLLMRSFVELQRVDPGFDPEHVLAVPLQLTDRSYPEPGQKVAFFDELRERIEALPGVTAAGATSIDPFSEWNLVNDVTPEELAAQTGPGGYLQAGWRVVTPGFFRGMGIPLRRGRVFDESDTGDGPRLAVISESLAERLWPEQDPIGRRLFWGGTDGTPLNVIGVVGDYRDVDLDGELRPVMFLPHNQLPWPAMTLVVRGAGDIVGTAAAVRQQIRAVDANLPIPEIRPLDESLSRAVATPRFRALLLAFFSAVALLLAAVGIYGVMAFGVARRTGEIGIRLALGARPESVSRMVMGRAGVIAGAGVALGLAGAWAVTRFLDSLLYRTNPTDAATFATMAALLGAVVLLASYLPARRAMRVDPMAALRQE